MRVAHELLAHRQQLGGGALVDEQLHHAQELRHGNHVGNRMIIRWVIRWQLDHAQEVRWGTATAAQRGTRARDQWAANSTGAAQVPVNQAIKQ
eukprot:3555485-Prymnesium_polylepis.1